MEEILKRLLDAEARASAEVARASSERERVIQEALEQARRAEAQFAEGLADLHAPYLRQAQERAETAIAELHRKYEERGRELRTLAEQRESNAIDAAIAILIDPRHR